MKEIIIMQVVRYLLSLALEEMEVNPEELKKKARDWIKDKIKSRWYERILLMVLDQVWDTILAEVKDELGRRGVPLPLGSDAAEVWPLVTDVSGRVLVKQQIKEWS